MSLQHLDLLLERLISEKLSEGNLRFRHNKVAGLEGIPCGSNTLCYFPMQPDNLPNHLSGLLKVFHEELG